MKDGRIGDILIELGVATPALIERALKEGRARREHVCTRLLALGVDEQALAAALSLKLGFPGLDLSRSVIELDLLELVPQRVAEVDLILPVSSEGGRLHLAMAHPTEDRILSEFRFVTGREVSPWIAVTGALRATIAAAYAARAKGERLLAGAAAGVRDGSRLAVATHREREEEDLVALEPVDDEPFEAAPAGEAQEEAEVTVEVEAPEGSARPVGPRRILVVDDEPEIRTLVQTMLQKKGYAVEVAVDGAEAISKAESAAPDLVLLDAMLPRIHGFDACRRIKNAPRTRRIPVIMMTAIYRGWRFAQDAREAYGAEDYVEKPFRLDDLLRRVEAALEAAAGRELPPRASADPAVHKGKELLLAGRLGEAVAAFESATRTDPWSADAWFHLARALRAEGDAFRAMTAFERSLEVRANHLPALRALAGLYEEKGFRRKAAEALERAFTAASDAETRTTVKADLLRLLG
ncbi:MAG TPA: response regulator [Anaeromyxobacteraceae bacterium]|nr:response regulator [Anaeromyxobacteraceae bacterium]